MSRWTAPARRLQAHAATAVPSLPHHERRPQWLRDAQQHPGPPVTRLAMAFAQAARRAAASRTRTQPRVEAWVEKQSGAAPARPSARSAPRPRRPARQKQRVPPHGASSTARRPQRPGINGPGAIQHNIALRKVRAFVHRVLSVRAPTPSRVRVTDVMSRAPGRCCARSWLAHHRALNSIPARPWGRPSAARGGTIPAHPPRSC